MTDTANGGDLEITPYRNGTQKIGWAVVTVGACGEQILAQGVRQIEITPVAAEIVVQDRFATKNPKQRIRSRAGTYDLLIFGGYFEVHDVATGSKLVGFAGTDPNFDPQDVLWHGGSRRGRLSQFPIW